MRLLVTRPQPDAERTAEALRNRGHQPMVAPMLHILPIPDLRFGLGPYAGLVLTSGNAVRAIAGHRKREEIINLPVLAVGDRTASEARRAGFDNVTSASGDLRDLAALATTTFKNSTRPLLYLVGENQAGDLASHVAREGIKVRTVVVYSMERVDALPDAVALALEDDRLDGVLHYSARSAEVYMDCADAIGIRRAALAPTHFCLSREIASRLQSAGARNVRSAPRPEESALLSLLDQG